MIEFLKRNRLLRIFVGGTAIVGAGAATGVAVAGNDTAPPPKKVPLGQPTKLDVEGQQVQVPPSTDMPQDVLDQPNANASANASPASPNSAVNNSTAAGVNTTANTAHVNTNSANSANTAEHQGEAPHNDGPAPARVDGGGDGGHDGGGHDGGGDGGHGGGDGH